ncbi:hypothetical protein KSC_017420 [Ktedonobacter sp. SOSP1-52]|nr:hypothetical protein KSC_017420 [Ktedonobacter sp. SOSP1-52]
MISAFLDLRSDAGSMGVLVTHLLEVISLRNTWARALQDPQQMDKALRGALALLESIEGRYHHADRTILHHVFSWRGGFPLYISAATESPKSSP